MMTYMFTLEEAVRATGGRISTTLPDTDPYMHIGGVSKDTRTIRDGDVYVAIKGERFDGHDYCADALSKGAVCVLVEDPSKIPEGAVGIVVDDSVKALGDLAHAYRSKLDAKVICVTGSVGKTTTRQMIATALGASMRVHSTKSNQNNEIGLPMTILEAPFDTQVLVLEMGMRGRGEISYLTNIACPDIAVITNVGYSHIERLGSREEIRLAKMEIAEGLTSKGILAVNGDDDFLSEYAGRMIPAGKLLACVHALPRKDSDRVTNCTIMAAAENVKYEDGGMVFDMKASSESDKGELHKSGIRLRLNGVHNVRNAAFAFLCAYILDADVDKAAEALAGFGEMKGRGEVTDNGRIVVINDAYNAGPESMEAAYANLALIGRGRRTIAVLGGMLELGDYAPMLHEQIGRSCGGYGFDITLVTGDNRDDFVRGYKESNPDGEIILCEDTEDVRSKLASLIRDGDVLLFKASNAFGFEKLAAGFTAEGDNR